MDPGIATLVASDELERAQLWGEDDPAVRWAGAFAVYGGHGTTQSSTIVYELEPGHRLGWHTDATEETQYIIAGRGKLFIERGNACARVYDEQYECGLIDGGARLAKDVCGDHLFFVRYNPARVDEPEFAPAPIRTAINTVARYSRLISYY